MQTEVLLTGPSAGLGDGMAGGIEPQSCGLQGFDDRPPPGKGVRQEGGRRRHFSVSRRMQHFGTGL